MPAYNVEIFSPDFLLKYHDNIGTVKYSEDYISPVENSAVIRTDDTVTKGDLIRIGQLNDDYFGVVTSVDYGEAEGQQMTVYYKPYTSLFNTDVLFDTDRQGTGSMETELKKIIEDNFVNNADQIQNIPSIGDITIVSNTTGWGLNLKSDTEGMHHCIVNFYDVFLVNGFRKYGISITVSPDYSEKKVNLEIGIVGTGAVTIETGLPNIIKKSIVIRETSDDTNKLEIYNTANYTERIIYYLHPDGTYDTSNADRIEPVSRDIRAVGTEEGQTFQAAAASEAASVFGQIQYDNLIEITALKSRGVLDATKYRFGQVVRVIHNGNAYESIFSGMEIGDTVKLSFGVIRLDLTKIVKRRA